MARWSNRQPIVESFHGEDPNAASTRAAVFVHYDHPGKVHRYVSTYLERLKQAGYRIWFMTNARQLDEASRRAVLPMVTEIKRRDNAGLDIGAYKDGVASVLAAMKPSHLILCNDSVYGPFSDLGPILERADATCADVWGMTESYEIRYHLQSYFVLYHRAALEHPGFKRFWASLPYVAKRGWLIHHGEIAMTQSFLAMGLRTRALFPHDAIAEKVRASIQSMSAADSVDGDRPQLTQRELQRRHFLQNIDSATNDGTPLNPTHFFWDILIRDLGFPFIKRDLLQFNPAGVPTIVDWRTLIASVSSYDTEQIREHLRPRLRGRVI